MGKKPNTERDDKIYNEYFNSDISFLRLAFKYRISVSRIKQILAKKYKEKEVEDE